MELITLLGYISAMVIGLVLGLIGGGGSILTIPVLVYLLNIDPILATAYSLFVVGTTSLFGTIRNAIKKKVDFKTGLLFALPTLVSVYFSRKYLIPALPETIFSLGSFLLTRNVAIMLFFAIIMLLAAISMIKGRLKKPKETVESKKEINYIAVVLLGLLIGLVTGIIGAGGGFLIVPALVFFLYLPMKKAVTTSLLVMAVNSLIGFTGDIQNQIIDWSFLGIFTGFSILGIFLGIYLNQFIDGKKLKKVFGWFVLLMAGVILFKELL